MAKLPQAANVVIIGGGSHGLATAYYLSTQEVAGEFYIEVTANPGHTLEEIQEVVEAELDRIRSEPPSAHELDRAKNRIESEHIRSLERFGGFGGRADICRARYLPATPPA